MKTINLIFRSKKRNEYSIENVFHSLIPYFEKYGLKVKCSYLPNERYNSVKAILENIRYVKTLKGDLFHITGEVNFIALFLNRKKTILTIHDLVRLTQTKGIKNSLYKVFFLYLPFWHVKTVTCISEKTKDEVNNLFFKPKKNILIPDPYDDLFKYQEKVFDNKIPTILAMGTRNNKNLERIIISLKDIKCKLLIVGKLSDCQRNMLLKYKISYDNRFDLTNKEIYFCYSEADILCFPSMYEGFGMPIIEAQAVGRPVITSNIKPMCDVAAKGALLVNPYSTYEINRAIKRIISDKILREKLVKQGLKNCAKYTSKSVARSYITLYDYLLK